MTIYAPVTEKALIRLLQESLSLEGPSAVRYSNFEEDPRVTEEFYSDSSSRQGYAVCNFSQSDTLDAVIVTYGKIVGEALKAMDTLRVEGRNVGIVLLERLKPYDDIYIDISALLPKTVKCVIFLEEGIRIGGAAMVLNDKFSFDRRFEAVNRTIMAIDDDFVIPQSGETVYDAAGISAERIVEWIGRNLR